MARGAPACHDHPIWSGATGISSRTGSDGHRIPRPELLSGSAFSPHSSCRGTVGPSRRRGRRASTRWPTRCVAAAVARRRPAKTSIVVQTWRALRAETSRQTKENTKRPAAAPPRDSTPRWNRECAVRAPMGFHRRGLRRHVVGRAPPQCIVAESRGTSMRGYEHCLPLRR